ncbi:hypothetical protein GQ53DRAFT_661270 [Thozetella sp. PMI_491]|nr:hypothetical protein GQ53DRAFT_661270 [Thozetella sp. PMI_491]
METAGIIVLIIFLLLIAAAIGWVVFTRMRAARLGLPPPSFSSYIPFLKSSASSQYGPPQPAPGGVQGWINDRIRMFKNRNSRTAAGAYEPSGAAPRARGFDPDEAWDSRVGHEDAYGPSGYYEEQELGLHPHHGGTSYGGGSSYPMNLAATPGHAPEGFGSGGDAEDEARGRTRSRSPGLTAPGARAGRPNPFDDDAEPSNISLRGVSPRPLDTDAAKAQGTGQKDPGSGDSPSERRSIFRENV